MPNKLELKVTADLGDLHLEAQPTFNLQAHSWSSTTMLRHPGAPRLAEALGMPSAAAWLGDGSLSLIAQFSGAAGKLSADSFELTAGGLHATGALALDHAGGRLPSLTGHIDAETLPLPLPYPRALDPLPIDALSGWEASVKLRAGRVLAGMLPVMEQAEASLALTRGVLRIDALSAKVSGGTLAGLGIFDSHAEPPTLGLNLAVTGAAVTGPLFDLPLDVTAGTLDLGLAVTASGHSPAALLATLGGDIHLAVRDGVLSGVAMGKADGDLTSEFGPGGIKRRHHPVPVAGRDGAGGKGRADAALGVPGRAVRQRDADRQRRSRRGSGRSAPGPPPGGTGRAGGRDAGDRAAAHRPAGYATPHARTRCRDALADGSRGLYRCSGARAPALTPAGQTCSGGSSSTLKARCSRCSAVIEKPERSASLASASRRSHMTSGLAGGTGTVSRGSRRCDIGGHPSVHVCITRQRRFGFAAYARCTPQVCPTVNGVRLRPAV